MSLSALSSDAGRDDASAETPWDEAVRAASIFAVDPVGMAGVMVRAQAGWVRDTWLNLLRDLLPETAPMRRLPLHIADSRLLGGLDLTATLHAGRPVAERGILAEADGGVVLLVMAERVAASTIARLGACLDTGEVLLERDGLTLRLPTRFGVVAFDESGADDERPLAALLDRLAFHIDLTMVGPRDAAALVSAREAVNAARAAIDDVDADETIVEAICATAIALGITSVRPALLSLRAARAIAALAGRRTIAPEDAATAARLVLAPRATQLPTIEQEAIETAGEASQAPAEPAQNTSAAEDERNERSADDRERPVDDRVLAAAAAAIPPGLLATLRLEKAARLRSNASGRAGVVQQSNSRGRPIGVRKGEPRSGARLNVIETLRAAVPWQRLRQRDGASSSTGARRIEIRRDDFRVARLKQRSETTTIFVVDASGSSALNRLAEAKGAVELLLSECYVRRDRVALIAFRGSGAELLLPPTRSLVRAKRSLAGLPGGGGTPLAAGIDAAAALADSVRRQGRTPVVIVMTDGRANIGRDGKPGRAQAEAEAFAAARSMRSAGLTALLIDTSPKAQPLAARLAAEMGAVYLPLPYADAGALSRSVRAASLTPNRLVAA